MAIFHCLVTSFNPSLIYVTVTYLHEEKINLVIHLKVFASEINKHQDQLHMQNDREHIWKMSEFKLAYDLILLSF